MDADLCRLCRVRNEDPSEDWPQLFDLGSEHLLEKIRACTNVLVIEHDLLPNGICFRCQASLDLAYTFRIQCDKVDARWRRQLELLGNDEAEPEGKEEKPILEAETIPVPGVDAEPGTDEIQTFFRGPNVKNSWNQRFQCRFCPKHFDRKCRLWEHEAQHTGMRQEVTESEQEEVPAEPVVVKQELDLVEGFVVEELPAAAVSENELESVPMIQPEVNVEPGTDDIPFFYQGPNKRFQCRFCPKHFARKCRLREHEELHQNVADSAFTEPVSEPEAEPLAAAPLEMNIESTTDDVKCFYRAPANGKDTWNKRFQCRYCPRHFGRKCRLREHETQHDGIRKCLKCGSGFLSELDLQAHEELMHNVTRPFSCDRCGNKFKTQDELTKHLKWHMTPRNFRCNVCFKAFSSKHSLDCHKETHQPKDYSKLRAQDLNQICMCPQCGHISHSHNAHVLHLRTHSGEPESATESESSSTFGAQDVNSSS